MTAQLLASANMGNISQVMAQINALNAPPPGPNGQPAQLSPAQLKQQKTAELLATANMGNISEVLKQIQALK
jgi:hypothetical protein